MGIQSGLIGSAKIHVPCLYTKIFAALKPISICLKFSACNRRGVTKFSGTPVTGGRRAVAENRTKEKLPVRAAFFI